MPTGLASTALVLSIAAPFGGQNWYYLTLLSPLSGFYYWQRGTRQEEVQVSTFTPSIRPCLAFYLLLGCILDSM